MSAQRTSDPIAGFLERLPQAHGALLALDYDGTLAPFRAARDRATPLPGIPETLKRIGLETATRLVIVSGRPAADVASLLGVDPPPEIWGVHGWERRLPDGSCERSEPAPAAASALDAARRALVEQGFGDLLDVKGAGLAIHWRGLDPSRAAAARAAAERAFDTVSGRDGVLHLLAVNNGLELRAAGRDKGYVLRTLLAEARPATAAVYVGDDTTDEDAFAAIAQRGLGILVAGEDRSTSATARLESPSAVLAFVQRWLAVAPRRHRTPTIDPDARVVRPA
jgi:trehalose-phosphatase